MLLAGGSQLQEMTNPHCKEQLEVCMDGQS